MVHNRPKGTDWHFDVLEDVLRRLDPFDTKIDFLLAAVMGHVDIERE